MCSKQTIWSRPLQETNSFGWLSDELEISIFDIKVSPGNLQILVRLFCKDVLPLNGDELGQHLVGSHVNLCPGALVLLKKHLPGFKIRFKFE